MRLVGNNDIEIFSVTMNPAQLIQNQLILVLENRMGKQLPILIEGMNIVPERVLAWLATVKGNKQHRDLLSTEPLSRTSDQQLLTAALAPCATSLWLRIEAHYPGGADNTAKRYRRNTPHLFTSSGTRTSGLVSGSNLTGRAREEYRPAISQ
jgi:hypothetical protein